MDLRKRRVSSQKEKSKLKKKDLPKMSRIQRKCQSSKKERLRKRISNVRNNLVPLGVGLRPLIPWQDMSKPNMRMQPYALREVVTVSSRFKMMRPSTKTILPILNLSRPPIFSRKRRSNPKIPLVIVLAIPSFFYPVSLAVSGIAPAVITGKYLVLKPTTQIPLVVVLAIPSFIHPVNLAVSGIASAVIAGKSLLKPPTQVNFVIAVKPYPELQSNC